jgi:hypothetical protein
VSAKEQAQSTKRYADISIRDDISPQQGRAGTAPLKVLLSESRDSPEAASPASASRRPAEA